MTTSSSSPPPPFELPKHGSVCPRLIEPCRRLAYSTPSLRRQGDASASDLDEPPQVPYLRPPLVNEHDAHRHVAGERRPLSGSTAFASYQTTKSLYHHSPSTMSAPSSPWALTNMPAGPGTKSPQRHLPSLPHLLCLQADHHALPHARALRASVSSRALPRRLDLLQLSPSASSCLPCLDLLQDRPDPSSRARARPSAPSRRSPETQASLPSPLIACELDPCLLRVLVRALKHRPVLTSPAPAWTSVASPARALLCFVVGCQIRPAGPPHLRWAMAHGELPRAPPFFCFPSCWTSLPDSARYVFFPSPANFANFSRVGSFAV